MADLKQGWTAAGGLILAAAAGWPALGYGAPPRSVVQLAPQRIAPARRPAGISGPKDSSPVESLPMERLPVEPVPIAPPTNAERLKESKLIEPPPKEIVHVPTPPAEPHRHSEQCRPQRNRPIAQWWERCKAHCRDKAWGYPEEFVPAPLGAAVADNALRQIARAQTTRMVLYQYDFLPMSDQLKPRSRFALAKFGEWASHGAGPVLVEPTPGHPELDEARRLAVWHEMQHGPFAVPPEMIAIGCPEVLGLRGGEALLVDKNLMMQTSSRGTAMGGGGAGGLLGGGMGGMGGMSGGMGGGMGGSSSSGGSSGSTGMGY
jgi:hypothetical protein